MKQTPFHHCSACGSSGLLSRSERELVCPVCHYRHFITPIPAAVALILDASGRILITRRAHDPGLGMLGLPGGVIEGGETGEQACARETLEEIGLYVPAEAFSYFRSLPNQYLFQDYVWPTLDLFYVAKIQSFDGITLQTNEVSEYFSPRLTEVSFSDFAFHSNAEAVRMLRDEMSHGVTRLI